MKASHLLIAALIVALLPTVAGAGLPSARVLAAPDPVQINFTLEGCRLGTFHPGTVTCDDADYTTGNLGKSWNELDLVPHRVTLENNDGDQTYSFIVAGDYTFSEGSPVGWDVISALTLNTALSDASCTAATMGPQTTTPSGAGAGGADQTIYRLVTITQQAGAKCVYDYYQRLAVGASQFSGASLQSNLWNQSLDASGIGQKRIQLPVNEIAPQELDKDMSATQDATHIWNITKAPTPAQLQFTNTCDTNTSAREQGVSITVEWEKLPATPSGAITVVTNVYATNPAARTITVNVTDQIRTGTTVLDTANSGDVDVPANTTLLVLTHQATVPSGTTDLNDVATASYIDKLTGVPIPGQTQATASADVQPSGVTQNASAVINDIESITGASLQYSADSFSGASGAFDGGYVAGTKTTGTVSWTSVSQSGSGSVKFDKTVYVTGPAITSGTLADTATLTGSDGFTADAEADVTISANALVRLTIRKTIPDVLQGGETASFTFNISGPDSYAHSVTIDLTAGETSKSTTVEGLMPGEYTVSEVPPAGWAAQPDQTVDIGLPACAGRVTFGNSVPPATARVKKVTVPAGSEAGWEFTLNGPGGPETVTTTGTGFVAFTTVLQEGSYTVSETAQDFWELKSVNGVPGAQNCSFSVDYPADAGAVFDCTFSNELLRGSITIIKDAYPPNGTNFGFGGDLGSFTLDDAVPNDGDGINDRSTFSGLLPGDFDVTETVPTGWRLASVVCTGGDSTPISNGVTIHLDPREEIECTFTNEKLVQVKACKVEDKDANPNTGGPTDRIPVKDWNVYLSIGGVRQTPGQKTAADGCYTWTDLQPGLSYDVEEDVPADWYAWTPTSHDFGASTPGGEYAYTFINSKRVTVKACKVEDKDANPNTATDRVPVQDWPVYLSIGGDRVPEVQKTGEDGCYTWTNLQPGLSYDVEEDLPADWYAWAGTEHDFGASTSGGSYEYTFINSKRVSVTACKVEDKDANPNTGGPTDRIPVKDWNVYLSIGGVRQTPGQKTGEDGCYTWTDLQPGLSYDVEEDVPADWYAWTPTKYDLGASTSGGEYAYTFINSKRVTVKACKVEDKDANPNTATDRVPVQDWMVYLSIGGVRQTPGQKTLEDGCYTWTNLDPGPSYDVEEDVPADWYAWTPAKYDFGASTSGGSYGYTFVNSRRVTITACKQEDVDGDPNTSSDRVNVKDWPVYLVKDGVRQVPTQKTGENGCYTWAGLEPGHTYAVGEDLQEGWFPWTEEEHSFGLPASGANLSFTFINSRYGAKSGFKWYDRDADGKWDGGEEGIKGWTIRLYKGGVLQATATTGDGGFYAFADKLLLPGVEYLVCEDLPTGWYQSFPTEGPACPNGTVGYTVKLQSGGTDTENNFGNFELGKIIVEKQTEPDKDPQSFVFTGDAAGTIQDGGQIVVDKLMPGTYTSTEILPQSQCSGQPLPNVAYLGEGAVLKAGKTYVVKGPLSAITQALSTIVWQEQFVPSSHWAAMGRPAKDVTFKYAAWQILDGARDPFLMYSPDDSPIDVVSLGTYPADVLISARVLDHSNYVHSGEARHAWFYLIRRDGSKLLLGQLEIAEPANITVVVPEAGEVQIWTHDSTVWWTTCESLDWKLISIRCDDANSSGNVGTKTATFNLEAGETVKCTFTDRKESALLVHKETEPDADPTRFVFTGNAAGDIADGAQLVRTGLEPGTYLSTETVPSGWDLTGVACDDANSSGNVGTATATMNVEAGEIVQCTFDNMKRATIIVEKQTVPDGDTTKFTFSGKPSGSIRDGQQLVVSNLLPGSYSSTETVPAGWELLSISCDDSDSRGILDQKKARFQVSAGETVKCTFYNKKKEAPRPDPVISVDYTADPVMLDEPSGDVEFHARVKNEGQLAVTLNSLVDNIFGDLTNGAAGANAVVDTTCHLPQTIGAGGSYECIYTGVVAGTPGTVENHTVTAAATDDVGKKAQASDGASVTIVNVPSSLEVSVIAAPGSVVAPGGQVQFTAVVRNSSVADQVSVSSLRDEKNTDLASTCPASLPVALAPGQTTTCTWMEQVTGSAGSVFVKLVTASGTDDDSAAVSDQGSANVEIKAEGETGFAIYLPLVMN